MSLYKEGSAIQKWVAALRSGAYPQTQLYLQTKRGFCCLGVACELYRQHFDDLEVTLEDSGSFTAYDGENQHLPAKVQSWLGLASPYGDYLLEDGSHRELTDDNDDGKSFTEIADIIEDNLASLIVDSGWNE